MSSQSQEKQFILQAKSEITSYQDQDYSEQITDQIATYNTLITNHESIKELLNKYKDENASMEKQLKTQTNEVLTNERKTFYEDQQNDQLNTYYYYIILIVYGIIVCIFGIFSLIYPSGYSWKTRAFIFIVFAVLPIISPWILGKVIQVLHWIYYLLPKNVYHSPS